MNNKPLYICCNFILTHGNKRSRLLVTLEAVKSRLYNKNIIFKFYLLDSSELDKTRDAPIRRRIIVFSLTGP